MARLHGKVELEFEPRSLCRACTLHLAGAASLEKLIRGIKIKREEIKITIVYK